MSNQFVQSPGDLAERTMLDRLNELREDVACARDDLAQFIERALGLRTMAAFEFHQSIQLKLLLPAWRADDFHARRFVRCVAIPV